VPGTPFGLRPTRCQALREGPKWCQALGAAADAGLKQLRRKKKVTAAFWLGGSAKSAPTAADANQLLALSAVSNNREPA